MFVLNGGTANSTTVHSSGYLYFSSGGSADDVTVNSGARTDVVSGATATNIRENGGYVGIANGASATFASNSFSGLSLSRESATLHSGTTAVSTTVNSYGSLYIGGGLAEQVTVSGGNGYYGNVYVYGNGTMNSATVNSLGCVFVSNGGVANSITVDYGGNLKVANRGVVNNAVLNSNGHMYVSNGGTANDVAIKTGGSMSIGSGGVASDVVVYSGATLSAGSYTRIEGLTVYSGCHYSLNADVSNATLFGGTLYYRTPENLWEDVLATDGVTIYISAGQINHLTMESGAILNFVSSGTIVTDLTMHEGTTAAGFTQTGGGSVNIERIEDGSVSGEIDGGVFSGTMKLSVGANIHGVAGTFTIQTGGAGSYTVSGSDLSNAGFSFAAGSVVDLSGNYFGIDDIDEIYSKYGFSRETVTIDSVLLTDPTTTFNVSVAGLKQNMFGAETEALTFRFSHEVDTSAFTDDSFRFASADGTPVAVTGWSLDGKVLTVNFETPATEGRYLLSFADTIRDLSGDALETVNSDAGLSSGWADTLTLRADLTAPRVVSVSPEGDFAGTLTEFRVNFSEAMDSDEVAKYVTLAAPDGSVVKPLSVKVANGTAVFALSPQTAYGEYTIRVSRELADYAGNRLDGNGNGVGGEAADEFTASFTIADVDLKVSDVRLSADTIKPGETLTVSWTDYNSGGYALSGSWTDGIYLSTDPRWDVNDILLGSVSHTGGLAKNATLENSLDVSVSGVTAGSYYLLVRSDIYMQEKGDRESALAAQNLEAVPLAVELSELAVGGSVSGHVASSGDYAVYKLMQEADQSLRLVLDSKTTSANMEVYVGYGYVPTREKYDSKVQKIADGELLLDASVSRRQVYVMIYNKNASAAFDYELAVENIPMSITRVTGTTQSNDDGSTFEISGVDFTPGTKVWLRDESGKKYEAAVSFVDPARIVATVAKGTLTDGKYSLVVEDGGETLDYSGDITIKNGAKAVLKASFYAPNQVGRHAAATLTISCTNTGDAPLDSFMVTVAPSQSHAQGPDTTGAILTLDASKISSGFWTATMPSGFSTSVSFLVEGAESSQIMPGETVKTNVYYLGWLTGDWDFGNSHINWNVSYLTDAEQDGGSGSKEPIDWSQITASANYSEPVRAMLVDNLTTGVGTTWGDYVRMLNRNRRYLDGIGAATDNLSAEELFQFEVMQDTGLLSPYRTLQSVADLTGTVPGALGFEVSRSYNSDLLSRERSGSFGYGWTTSLDSVLEISSDGDLRFFQGASERLYQPNYSNGYQSVAGDGSVMKKTKTGYQLTEHSGIVRTFDATGKLLSAADCNGNTISYSYDEAGKLTGMTHSCGETFAITRDDAGWITRIAAGGGQSVSYAYDANGNLISATDGRSGNAVTYDYSSDLAHALTGVTDASGAKFVYTYGDNGLLTDLSSRDGAYSASITYGTDGDVTVTDSLNRRVTYYYDNASRLCRTADAVSGVTTYYRYDADGNLKSVSDSRGNTASFAYDALGQLTASTDANGNTVKMTYTADGYTAGVTDERGNVTEYTYDAKNNLTGIYYSDGSCETFTYDSAGNVSTATDVKGIVTSYSYDSRGNVTRIRREDRTVNYSYDVFGNLVGVTNADGSTGAYTFNGLDLLTGFTDANGNVTTYAYDDAGRATSVTYADGTKESLAYNAAGDLVKWINRRGGAVNYTVDALGNTVKLARADGAVYDFAYDASGRMTTAGDLSFTYNDFDYVTGVTTSDGRGIVYAYDAFDRVVSVSDGVNTTNYSYTVYGNLDKLTDGAGVLIADYDYDRFGKLAKVTNGNGTYTTYTYDDLQELTSIETFDKSGASTGKTAYTYNTNGEIATKTTADGTWSYTYDKVGQLTAAVLVKDNTTVRSEAYTYDAMGNRLTSTIDGVTKTYTYDNMNRIVSADGFAYRYDADGNLLEDEERIYTWTTDNRVASEKLKSTGQVWTYGYDALGNRTCVTTNGVTTTYTVDTNGNVLAEYVNGAFVRSYIQGNSLAAFTDASGSTYYYNSDLLGSTSGITNGAGATVNTYSYDSFGNVLSSTEGVANDFEFVGVYGLMANASGTTFVRARNYDAATGRWISADPIGIEGGENLYVYCGNESISTIDLDGCEEYGIIRVHNNNLIQRTNPKYTLINTSNINSISTSRNTNSSGGYIKTNQLSSQTKIGGAGYFRTNPFAGQTKQIKLFKNPKAILGTLITAGLINIAGRAFSADADGNIVSREGDSENRKRAIDQYNSLKQFSDSTVIFIEPQLAAALGLLLQALIEGRNATPISGNNSTISYSYDPNDKTVTEGYGEAGYIAGDTALNYKVEFENDPEWATAPARWVRVYDTLAEEFDLDTFELKSICIAGNYIEVGDGRDSFNELRELNINGDKVLTQISVNLDPETREIFAEFTAIDPETGWMLQDVERGILLPNDAIGSGEGFFTYSVALKEGVAHGTEVTNTAKIYFDFNDPIDTPTTLNTIDGVDPSVASIGIAAAGSTITLTFAGEDADSGIAGYNIMYSTDGENFTVYGYSTYSELAINGTPGTTYYFKAQAVDNVGNASAWSAVKSVKIAGVAPENLTGTQAGLTWDAVSGATGYVVEYSTDDFTHLVRIYTENTGLSSFCLPQGTYQWRVRAKGSDEWVSGENIAAETASSAPQLIRSDADGVGDLFFANAAGAWAKGHAAQHVGVGAWAGTKEIVELEGRNRLADIFAGSDDANVLLMTDAANGDALFVDDIYTAFPDGAEAQSRIARINEIRAGAGDDVVDMTSQRFAYTGDGVTVRGGLGNDTVWANKGDNFLFGDAGNDRLVGASGNDVLVGGIGDDRMHGGGGNDVFAFSENWGIDTVVQLADGCVTLWFASGNSNQWDAANLTYADGKNSVTVTGVTTDRVTLKFGDDGTEEYATLAAAGAFADASSEKIFEEKGKGILASL